MMDQIDTIFLTKPTPEYKQAVLAYRDEFIENDEIAYGSDDIDKAPSYESWLKNCIDGEILDNVAGNRVPASQYLAIRLEDNKLVGMIQIRHTLNDQLKKRGGHIGYSVRKSERRKGYATRMLGAALKECKELGIKNVLLTCKTENVASAAVMKANGAIFEKQVQLDDGDILDYYWITYSN